MALAELDYLLSICACFVVTVFSTFSTESSSPLTNSSISVPPSCLSLETSADSFDRNVINSLRVATRLLLASSEGSSMFGGVGVEFHGSAGLFGRDGEAGLRGVCLLGGVQPV